MFGCIIKTNNYNTSGTWSSVDRLAALREKGPSRIANSKDPDQPLHDNEYSFTQSNCLHSKNVYDIDVTSVKKCRPWSDAASETRRLLWVYTLCKCPNVPFHMTLAKWLQNSYAWTGIWTGITLVTLLRKLYNSMRPRHRFSLQLENLHLCAILQTLGDN